MNGEATVAADGGGTDEQDRELAAFMASLERELVAGEVSLPSWSKVTERARTALAAPTVNVDELARILGAEAGLAVRVLTLANSAMFMRGGRPLSDLKLAILRIGHDMLRSAVYAHALLQLRQAPRLQRLRPVLQELWRESTQVAALARLVATRTADSDPDAALLAGLLHNIGKLYLYVRLDARDDQSLAAPVSVTLLTAWHARIGAAIARNWQMPEALCQAVADQDLLDDGSSQSPLGAALSVAPITATLFGLNAAEWLELLGRAQAESTALRVTFGD
jgi:HD-like signal output (HDOD) protein